MPDIFDQIPDASKKNILDTIDASPGTLSRAWKYINTPLVKTSPIMDSAREQFAREHPIIGGMGNFATDALLSSSSPLGLGLAAATGGSSLAEKAGLEKLASTLEVPGKVAAGGMVGHGLYRVGTEPTYGGKFGGLAEAGLGGLGLRRGVTIEEKPESVLTEPKYEPLPQKPTVLKTPESTSGTPIYNTPQFGLHLSKESPPYPLSTVPNRYRPPSTNATVFDALLPERMKVNEQGAATPLTSAVERGGVTSIVDSLPNADVPKPVSLAAESKVPEIQAAATDVAKSGLLDKLRSKWPASLEAQLEQQGPAGKALSDRIARASLKERMYKSQWLAQSPTANDLSPADFSNAVDVLENHAEPNSPEVAKAAQEMASVLNGAGQGLVDSGITTKSIGGKQVPFTMQDNYFPHYYPEGFWDRPEIIDDLVKSGMSRDEALDIVQNRKKYGELLSSFQHQRIPTDLPGYLKTSDAYEQYLNTAARRLAMAQELGPEDIVGQPLNSLIEKTTDPNRTTQILRRIIPGRDADLSPTARAIQPINNMASKLMAYAHLSRYAVSRIAPSTEMIIRGGARNFLSEITKVLTDSGYADDIKTGTGVTSNISNAMLDAVNKYPTNWMMSKSVDDFMRTVSGGMGRGVAEDLFSKLKIKPDAAGLTRLQNLILEDPAEALKQDALTKDQINMAGARFSELTQGLPENRKVPMAMSEPLYQIPLIMKKYAFQHAAMLKNAIKQNPAKGIPLALGLTQLFGEGIGDTKAALKGIGSSAFGGEGPDEKIANRGQYESMMMKRAGLGENPALGRLMDNFANAWVPFEIELLQSISDKNGLVRALGGPAIGDASDLLGGGINGVGKYIGANMPIIGSR